MLDNFSETSVAWRDVSLDYLLKVLVHLVTDAKLRADVGTNRLVGLSYVNVNDVVFKELPSESEMILAS